MLVWLVALRCFALLCFGGGEGRGGENVRPTSARVDFLHGVEAKTSKIVTVACLLRRKVKMIISGPKRTKFARRLGETPRSEILLEIFSQKWDQRHEKAREVSLEHRSSIAQATTWGRLDPTILGRPSRVIPDLPGIARASLGHRSSIAQATIWGRFSRAIPYLPSIARASLEHRSSIG